MAVPKRRTSRRKRDQRRAHHDKVVLPNLIEIEYQGKIVVIPRRLSKGLRYMTTRELYRLGVES